MMATGFIIDGEELDVPELNSLNMDEAMTLYQYSGLTLEDFAPDEEDGTYSEERDAEMAERAKNPGFIAALMHIALGRAHPDWRESRVKNLVKQSNLLDALEQFIGSAGDAEDDASPPEPSLQKPPESSPRSSADSSASSGPDSASSLDEPDENLEPIGTGVSDTSRTLTPIE